MNSQNENFETDQNDSNSNRENFNKLDIEDPFIISDTNSSIQDTRINRRKSVENEINSFINSDLIVNESTNKQSLSSQGSDENIKEIKKTTRNCLSEITDLIQLNEEKNENILPHIDENNTVVDEVEVQVSSDKEKQNKIDRSNMNSESLNNNENRSKLNNISKIQAISSTPLISTEHFTTSRISIQKLPKNRPTTSAAANNNENSLLNGNLAKETTKKLTKETKPQNHVEKNKIRYRHVRVVRIIKQTSYFTFREVYDPSIKDYGDICLVNAYKTKEQINESSDSKIIQEKDYQDDQTNYFDQLDNNNENNFSSNSSVNSSMMEENQNENTLTIEKKLSKKRKKNKNTTSEESGVEEEESKNEKKQPRQRNAKSTSKAPRAKRTKANDKTAKKAPLNKRDMNIQAVENYNRNDSAASSIYTVSRASSLDSRSPSIDSSVFENFQSSRMLNKRKMLNQLKIDHIDLETQTKIINYDLEIRVKKLSENDFLKGRIAYKSDESSESTIENDITLTNDPSRESNAKNSHKRVNQSKW